MGKKKNKEASKELNAIKRLFWEIASRFESNTVKINKIIAHCNERRQHFFDKWTNKEKEQTPELEKSIEDDRRQIILMGSQNQEKILSLVEGKTLVLDKDKSIRYYSGARIVDISNEDLVVESLEELEKREKTDIKGLITTDNIIPKKNMAEAIKILEASGHFLAETKKGIIVKAFEDKIKKGELDPEKIKGVKITQNEFFGVHTPNVDFSENIKTTTKEF